jgi:HK97 family phage portal protein
MGLFNWFNKKPSKNSGTVTETVTDTQKKELFVGPNSQYIPSIYGAESAGIAVNHDSALTFTGAFAAISIKAENLASLPKAVFKNTSKGKVEESKHPIYKLIHYQPNPHMTDFVFWELIEANIAGWGNAYALIESGPNGRAKALWPMLPNNVQIIKSEREIFYKVIMGDFSGTYSADEFLHFKIFTRNGYEGIDPISYHAQSIGLALAGQKFASEYFESKGALRGVFEMDGELGEKAYQKLNERLNNAANHSTRILEYGMKYKPISISPDAAQVIQSRIFSIQDASRIWKVPVSLLAEHSHSTFSNTEQQDIQFVKYGLRPECKRIETELETKLFSGSEREVMNVKFDLKGLLRGDLKTQAQFYHSGIQDGWLSRNEVREMENRNPVEGLDEYLVPQNMTLASLMEKLLKDGNNNDTEE